MSAVSRSVYQKVCEENKRLKADIKILTDRDGDSMEYVETVLRWRKLFREETVFDTLLHEHAAQYMKDHPEIKIPTI